MSYTRVEFQTDQEVRWCPGCGDYTILAAVQNFFAGLDIKRENVVFVIDIVWRWDGTRYLRSADGEPQLWRSRDGDETGQIEADVLIVLMAERYTDCPPGEGSCVPAWNTVGENRAIVFGQGRFAEGRWRRESAGDWFRIMGPGGDPITVPPGRLWIMIYPETSGLVW